MILNHISAERRGSCQDAQIYGKSPSTVTCPHCLGALTGVGFDKIWRIRKSYYPGLNTQVGVRGQYLLGRKASIVSTYCTSLCGHSINVEHWAVPIYMITVHETEIFTTLINKCIDWLVLVATWLWCCWALPYSHQVAANIVFHLEQVV